MQCGKPGPGQPPLASTRGSLVLSPRTLPKEEVHPSPTSLSGASPPWVQPAPDCQPHGRAWSSGLIPEHPRTASFLNEAHTIFALHSQNSMQSLSTETIFPLTSTTLFTGDSTGYTQSYFVGVPVTLLRHQCSVPSEDLPSLLSQDAMMVQGNSSQSRLQPRSTSACKLPLAQSLSKECQPHRAVLVQITPLACHVFTLHFLSTCDNIIPLYSMVALELASQIDGCLPISNELASSGLACVNRSDPKTLLVTPSLLTPIRTRLPYPLSSSAACTLISVLRSSLAPRGITDGVQAPSPGD